MSTISPLTQYQQLVNNNTIKYDASQQACIAHLEQLYTALTPFEEPLKEPLQGLYLWGKVGRGKTFLMDMFVSSLPTNICKRQHFHHFMQDVHHQLKQLSGKPEPLNAIAKTFSERYRVLCFDEFFVSDIGDAMLLGNLLQYMFELNIIVLCTSNCAPKALYKNGLQRERFLPAIAAIEKHTKTIHLDGIKDHRLRALTYKQNYFLLPSTLEKQTVLHQSLLNKGQLTSSHQNSSETCDSTNVLSVLGRDIPYIAVNSTPKEKTICFEFSQLCEGPRSHLDYVELAKHYKTILLFNVPPLSGQSYERIKARGTEDNGSNINVSASTTGEREVVLAPMDDAVRRFIALVDECYDCHINLVITSYVAQNQLYNSGSLMFEFERTKSRLVEMASVEYFNKQKTSV